MDRHTDIAIIGGGIVGLATAWQLSQRMAGKKVKITVLEKENELAFHQTGHNSGVIHSGIYYRPGSLRAINCQKGRKSLVAFARAHGIAHELCGKLIVATRPDELPRLDKIFQNGIANGTEGIEIIDAEGIRHIEPYCAGIKAISVPCAGIIDFPAVARKYAELLIAAGGEVLTGTEVKAIEHSDGHYLLRTSAGDMRAGYLVACGGSQSDRLALQDGLDPGMRIVGFRGEYYELENKERVRHLIYPVPDPRFPWLGVHFTRMIDGSIECGPNAVFAFHRDGYHKSDFKWQDVRDAITYRGFWKLTTKHLAYGISEQWRSISKKAFHRSLLHLIPSLQIDEIHPGRSGVRALALDPEGDMLDDFKILQKDRATHVLNAPSPAATASIAIGEQVAAMVVQTGLFS